MAERTDIYYDSVTSRCKPPQTLFNPFTQHCSPSIASTALSNDPATLIEAPRAPQVFPQPPAEPHTPATIELEDLPEGYVENAGHCTDFYIPTPQRGRRLAKYIRLVPEAEYTRVAGRLEPEGPTYYREIFAHPHHMGPPSPAPAWFIRGIQASSEVFNMVREEALALDDWGAVADISRYHQADERLMACITLQQQLEEECRAIQGVKLGCRVQLEAARTPQRLGHLESAEGGRPPLVDRIGGCGRPL